MSDFVTILIEGYYVENLSTGADHWFMPSQFDGACAKLAELQAAGHQCRLIAEVDA